ncbi:MAG: hypothetical protein FWD25_04460 [Clostridia bacterium]|nr:hypothetical protein [Clostridia bacterium]
MAEPQQNVAHGKKIKTKSKKMRLYQQKSRWPRTVALSALGLALVVFVSVSLLGQAGERMYAQQLATLENALRRAAVTCYALEGRYPDTLDYLTDNYGVVIDSDRFIVSYSVFGRNVMPSIEVFSTGSDGGIEEAFYDAF